MIELFSIGSDKRSKVGYSRLEWCVGRIRFGGRSSGVPVSAFLGKNNEIFTD